jgi:hypothetical protein
MADVPTGPTVPQSAALTAEEEAVIVAFRRHTLLALDDCLYALQPSINDQSAMGSGNLMLRKKVARL